MKKSGRIGLRVAPEDKQKWEREAAMSGMSLSAWIEMWVNWGIEVTEKIESTRQPR